MATMSQLRNAIGACVLITSAAIAASEATEGASPQGCPAGNIQVDCLIVMGRGTARTNRNISICIREGSEITAKEVTDAEGSAVQAEKGAGRSCPTG